MSETPYHIGLGAETHKIDPIVHPKHPAEHQTKARLEHQKRQPKRTQSPRNSVNQDGNRNRVSRLARGAVAVTGTVALMAGVAYGLIELAKRDDQYVRIDNENRNGPVGGQGTGEHPQGVPPAKPAESVDNN